MPLYQIYVDVWVYQSFITDFYNDLHNMLVNLMANFRLHLLSCLFFAILVTISGSDVITHNPLVHCHKLCTHFLDGLCVRTCQNLMAFGAKFNHYIVIFEIIFDEVMT